MCFGEGFAVEFLINLFCALPSTDSFNAFVGAAKVLDICGGELHFPISVSLHADDAKVEVVNGGGNCISFDFL